MKRLLALLLALFMIVGMVVTASAVVLTEEETEDSKIMFNNCESKDGWWSSSGNPTVDPTEKTEGNASILLTYSKYSGKPGDIQFAYALTEPVDSSRSTTFSFDLWVGTDAEAKALSEAPVWIELTSSGTCDKLEKSASFGLNDLVTGGVKKGWNRVTVPLGGMNPAGGQDKEPMDPSKCNFMRMFSAADFSYLNGNTLTIRVDNFHFDSPTLSDGDYVADCDKADGWSAPGGVTFSVDNVNKTQGEGSVTAYYPDVSSGASLRAQYKSSLAIDISQKLNLEFDLWLGDGADVAKINTVKFWFELSSSGISDHQEINVCKTFEELTGKKLVEGWNHVVIPLSAYTGKTPSCGANCTHSTALQGDFDATRWNFLRIYNAGDCGTSLVIKFDALTFTSGGSTTEGDLYTFKVGDESEKKFLTDEAVLNNTCRYADKDKYFTYKYTLDKAVGDAMKLEWRGYLYQQYLVTVSTDGETFVRAAAYDGPETNDGTISRAPSEPICIDLLPYVNKDTTTIYVRIGDVYPTNGWGGALPVNSEVALEVGYIPGETVKLSGVDIADKVYDGKTVTPEGALICTDKSGKEFPVSDSDLVYTWSVFGGEEIDGAPSDAGTYLLTISMKDPAYKGRIRIKFTIEKAPMTITVKDQSVAITKSGQTINHTLDVEGVNIRIANAIKQGKYEFTTKPVEGKPGEFTVEIKALDRAGISNEYSNYNITFNAGKLNVTCADGAHTYGDTWESDDNEHWHACVWCGAKAEATAHKYSAACDEDCDICGATRKVTHTYGSDWKTDGLNHWKECSVCGSKKDVSVHIYSNDCAESCNICGYKRTITHDWKVTWSYDETNHWHICKKCGLKKDEAAHTWDNGQVKKAPTVDTEGTMQYTCTECGSTKTGTIAKLDPITVAIADKTWKSGDLTVTTSVSEKTLTGVSVDGTVIGPENYTIVDGNVVLSESYLKTLEKGEHTVTIASTANTESDTFTVAGSSMNPTVIIIIVAAVVVVAVVVVIVIVVSKKKKK